MRDCEISGNNTPSVAIAGCGAICSVGKNTSELLVALKNNTSGLRASERFSNPRFQSNIVGAAPIDSSTDNPAHALASSALHEAIVGQTSDAAINNQIPAERIGLVLSTTKANIEALERLSDGRSCSVIARRHLQADLLAADLAVEFDARGPVQNISNACVSGLATLDNFRALHQRDETRDAGVGNVLHRTARPTFSGEIGGE